MSTCCPTVADWTSARTLACPPSGASPVRPRATPGATDSPPAAAAAVSRAANSLGGGHGGVLRAGSGGLGGIEPRGVQRQRVQRGHLPGGDVLWAPRLAERGAAEEGVIQQDGHGAGDAAGFEGIDSGLRRAWRARRGPERRPGPIPRRPGARRPRRSGPPSRGRPRQHPGAEAAVRAQDAQGRAGCEELHVRRRNAGLVGSPVEEHLPRGGVLDDAGEGAGAVGLKGLVQLRGEGGPAGTGAAALRGPTAAGPLPGGLSVAGICCQGGASARRRRACQGRGTPGRWRCRPALPRPPPAGSGAAARESSDPAGRRLGTPRLVLGFMLLLVLSPEMSPLVPETSASRYILNSSRRHRQPFARAAHP